jgi:voltage-gated potassium channel Kch
MRFSIVVIVCSSDRLEIRVILLAKSIEPDLDYQGKL